MAEQKIKTERRGGKRKNAGRKPSTLNGIVKKLDKDTAALILAKIDSESKWIKLSSSRDERVVLETMKYLTDRAHGKPKQSMDVNGDFTLKTVVVSPDAKKSESKPQIKPEF